MHKDKKEKIVEYLKSRPLYIEILRSIILLDDEKREITPTTIRLEIKRGLSTISKPLNDIANELQIIKAEKEGRKRIYHLTIPKKEIIDILGSDVLLGYLIKSAHRIRKKNSLFYKGLESHLAQHLLRQLNLKTETKVEFEVPFLRNYKDRFDFVVTAKEGKRIEI